MPALLPPRVTVATLLAALATVAPGPLMAQRAPAPIPGIEDLIRTGMRDDAIPGLAIAIVDSGRVVWLRGFGVADRATRRPVDPDSTLFRLGSVTKALTALGVLRLVDRGILSLETAVRDVAPLAPLRATPWEPVRIHHLLSHTGGFDQTGLGRHAPSTDARPSLRAFLEAHLVPIRPPGAVATYDTYGISLAGHVLEAAGGTPYAEFMRTEVFEPLGMRQTFIEASGRARQQLAVGYGLQSGTHVPQPYEWYVTLPASSAEATAADVARLMIALLGDGSNTHGRLLRPATVERLRRGAFDGGAHPFWQGWWSGRFRGRPLLFHGGVMRGYSSQLVLLPDRGAGFFVAYNRDPETGPPPALRDRLTAAFLEYMLGAGEAVIVASIEMPTDAFAGSWVAMLGCFTCREGEGWPLSSERIAAAGPGAIRFRGARWLAVDSLTFRDAATGALLRFRRAADGVVRYANAGHDGYERLDDALIARVAASGREPGVLRALLARAAEAADRPRAMAALAARAPAVDPAGTLLFRPDGAEGGESMRVELRRADGRYEGWFQPRASRPRRTVQRVIVGGNQVWIVVEVPGGVLDLILELNGESVTGVLREESEEVRISGRHIPPGS